MDEGLFLEQRSQKHKTKNQPAGLGGGIEGTGVTQERHWGLFQRTKETKDYISTGG